jgi:hypothetical protein
MESQQDVRWDMDKEKSEIMKQVLNSSPLSEKKKAYVFTFSGTLREKVAHYTKIIQELGASISENFNPTISTHVVAGAPTKTEKTLCAIAANVWIVHPNFLERSFNEGLWVDEADYAWTPELAKHTNNIDEKTIPLLKAMKRVTDDKINYRNGGPTPKKLFVGWHVLLSVEAKGISNLLLSGGAEILGNLTQWQDHVKRVTHVIVNKKLSDEEKKTISAAQEAGLRIWIQDHLFKYMVDPNMDTSEFELNIGKIIRSTASTNSSSSVLGKRSTSSLESDSSSSGSHPVKPTLKRLRK